MFQIRGSLASVVTLALGFFFALPLGHASAALKYGTPAATAALSFDPFARKGIASGQVPFVAPRTSQVRAPSADVVTRTPVTPETVIVSVNDAPSVLEGPFNTPGLKAFFTITLNKPSNVAVSVDYSTANGTARAGIDYVATSGKVTFQPTEVSKVVEVSMLEDGPFGPSVGNPLSFNLNLFNATTGLTIGRNQAVCRRFERTRTEVGVYVSDPAPVIEDGQHLAVFTISLTAPTTKTVTMDYRTKDGSALALGLVNDIDYQRTTGNLTFLPGQTIKTVKIPVFNNTSATSENVYELFYFELFNVKGAFSARTRGVAQIIEGRWI